MIHLMQQLDLFALSSILYLMVQKRIPSYLTRAGPLQGAGPNLTKLVKSAENRPCPHRSKPQAGT